MTNRNTQNEEKISGYSISASDFLPTVLQLSDSMSLSVSLWPLRYKVQILNSSWHSMAIHKLTRETRDQETLNRNLELKHCSQFWSLIFTSFSAANRDVTVSTLVVDESHLQRCVVVSEKTFCVFSRCQGAFFFYQLHCPRPSRLPLLQTSFCSKSHNFFSFLCFLFLFFSLYLENCQYCEEPGCVYCI